MSLNDGGRYFKREDSFLSLSLRVGLGETAVQVESRGNFYQRLEGTLSRRAMTVEHCRVHVLSEASTDGTGRSQAEISREGKAGRFLCGG